MENRYVITQLCKQLLGMEHRFVIHSCGNKVLGFTGHDVDEIENEPFFLG